MIYLLDSSVLIQAKDEWYPIPRFRQVWEWLERRAKDGVIKIPKEIYDEIQGKEDPLTIWTREHKDILIIDEDISHLAEIYKIGYLFDEEPIEEEKERIGKDPFLLNYCMNDIGNRAVVSNEASKPTKKKKERRIPDACAGLGITHYYMHELLDGLDFVED